MCDHSIGCSPFAWPDVSPLTLTAAPGNGRLVTILLRGGLDGLDMLRPTGDPHYAHLRPGRTDGLELTSFFKLHPALKELLPLWEKEELAFVHACSTPYRNGRSHFDGQDVLEAGTGADVSLGVRQGGWLNRALSTMNAPSQTAYAIGREAPLILRGDAPYAHWSPDITLSLHPRVQRLTAQNYAADPLFGDAFQTALELSKAKLDASAGPGFAEDALAKFAAERLKEDARIAAFSLNGWDTHNNQDAKFPNLLRRLSDTLLTLKRDLGPVWGNTCVLAMTEFGRRAAWNGTGGTDHGTGGVMIMAGGAVQGKRIYGRWPGLEESHLFDRRDVMPTSDVRSYAGLALHQTLGISKSIIEDVVFPGTDLSS